MGLQSLLILSFAVFGNCYGFEFNYNDNLSTLKFGSGNKQFTLQSNTNQQLKTLQNQPKYGMSDAWSSRLSSLFGNRLSSQSQQTSKQQSQTQVANKRTQTQGETESQTKTEATSDDSTMPCDMHSQMSSGNTQRMSNYYNNYNNRYSNGYKSYNNGYNSLNSYFGSQSSIDISFDSMMNELLSDVLYLQLASVSQSGSNGVTSMGSQSQSQSQSGRKGGMILLLNNPSKVSTDTIRFNIDLSYYLKATEQSRKKTPIQYFTETEVVYLCTNKKCRESERYEMTTISSNYSPKSGKFNAHLVATTTTAPLVVKNYEFADSGSSSEDADNYDPSKDLILVEITVIIVLIIVCGVGYAIFRCALDQRDAQRELKILMAPTGLGLLQNELGGNSNHSNKSGKSSQSNKKSAKSRNSGSVKTLNETFDNGNFTTQYSLINVNGDGAQ